MHSIYPWQQAQWQYLLERKKNNVLPHALLLFGIAGLGKLTFAQAVANLLLCEQGNETACGQCQSCRWTAAGTHPDLFLIQPETTGKMIKVDQIRDLTEALANTAQCNGYQIAIIEPAEAMNMAAANALLKTLEEPAGKVILMLVCHHLASVPATIRSRCQKLIFKTNEKSSIKHWLQQQLPEKDSDLLLTLTDYAPLQAMALNQEGIAQRLELIEHFMQLLNKRRDPIQLAANYSKDESKQLLTILLGFIADLIRIRLVNNPQFIVYQSKIAAMQAVAAHFSLIKLFQFYDRVLENLQLIYKNINLNQQLLLESLFMGLAELNT